MYKSRMLKAQRAKQLSKEPNNFIPTNIKHYTQFNCSWYVLFYIILSEVVKPFANQLATSHFHCRSSLIYTEFHGSVKFDAMCWKQRIKDYQLAAWVHSLDLIGTAAARLEVLPLHHPVSSDEPMPPAAVDRSPAAELKIAGDRMISLLNPTSPSPSLPSSAQLHITP